MGSNEYSQFIDKSDYSIKTKDLLSYIVKISPQLKEDVNYLFDCSRTELEKLILDLKPTSSGIVSTYMYVLSIFSKWCAENCGVSEITYSMLTDMDRHIMWEKSKYVNNTKKYVSNEQFKDILKSIDVCEEYNTICYVTLLQCIYDGLYSPKLSILRELRYSDVDFRNKVVRVHCNDGYKYINVSNELIRDFEELREYSEMNRDIWYKKNGHGIAKVQMYGRFTDSIFKVEHRDGKNKQDILSDKGFFNGNKGEEEITKEVEERLFNQAYLYKIRKVIERNFYYTVKPYDLYVSGIMYRICETMKRNDVNIEYAFSKFSFEEYDTNVRDIIETELKRSNYDISVSNFKAHISGFIEVFI